MIARKAPHIEDVAKRARERPFRAGDTIYRHKVSVLVDTAEVNEKRVADAVQHAVDEVTSTIQDDDDVTFDEATVVHVERVCRCSAKDLSPSNEAKEKARG